MDFDITPYSELRNALLPSGIRCGINGRHQIAVSVQDGAVWPGRGNSFWVTCATGTWHLFTWSPVGYAIPNGSDIPGLCRRCMAVGGTAMYRVPDDIIADFAMTELGEEEINAVYIAMKTAK